MVRLSLGALCVGFVSAQVQPWWAWGNDPVYPLQVPADLSAQASPVWHPNTSSVGAKAEFVFARAQFAIPKPVKHAVAFVTAQQSPLCTPDPRLDANDYGSCVPGGGSSQPKLLGAYKLHVNGRVVGTGPGRRVNQTQGVDAFDVLPLLHIGASAGNVVGLQGYHSARFTTVDAPRLMLLLQLTFADGTQSAAVATGRAADGWMTLDADSVFNPTKSTGAWAGDDGQLLAMLIVGVCMHLVCIMASYRSHTQSLSDS
jgi:hypothetical protein